MAVLPTATFTFRSATASDHPALEYLLAAVFHRNGRPRIATALDDPHYEPCQRWVATCAGEMISHVYAAERAMHLGAELVPAVRLVDVATAPECRRRGLATTLVMRATDAARKDGALVATLRTGMPHFFLRQGWALCGRHSYSSAGSRELLAQVSGAIAIERSPIAVRPWRQLELTGLVRLYAAQASAAWGAIERTEAYWRWLVLRRDFDQLLLATTGDASADLRQRSDGVVGYVVVQGDQVLELEANQPSAARLLLQHVAREAIERGQQALRVFAPPASPLHGLASSAGGYSCQQESSQGEVFMARLLNPLALLRKLSPTLFDRAKASGHDRAWELGIRVDDELYLLAKTGRSVRVSTGRKTRSMLHVDGREFTRIVLGHSSAAESALRGRLQGSTRLATELAEALFPRTPLWYRPLDELACG